MKNFAEFLKANREKIYADAESKTLRNSKGQTVIERSDPWFDEDEWDCTAVDRHLLTRRFAVDIIAAR